MHVARSLLPALFIACLLWLAHGRAVSGTAQQDRAADRSGAARAGGSLVVAQRSEPKTFNPLIAADAPSKDVIWRTTADLIHINRETQRAEPALASSWSVSADGREYTIKLRRGLRFSDGHPFDADDVVFSIGAYLDERVQSPQRDLLKIDGKPITVRKIDPLTVKFELAAPYAAAERLFDGIAMLPRHVLESKLRDGTLKGAWSVQTPAASLVGLGPFRVADYRPGDQLVFERNPNYWKTDARGVQLPYLQRLVMQFVPSEEAQIARFRAGEIDLLSRIPPQQVAALEGDAAAHDYTVRDLGASLEYSFLAFNLNDGTPRELASKQTWFRDERFRRAVSMSLDRAALVRLAYRGRATAIGGHVTPGNRLWANTAIRAPEREPSRARELFAAAGFRWCNDGVMIDRDGVPVAFSLLVPSGNTPLLQMATVIEDDLRGLGIHVQVAPLEFRALLDHVLDKRDFDAALLRLGSGDADPNAEINVWLSTGQTHLWQLHRTTPPASWEAEIDRLMQLQLTTTDAATRKRLYDRVQAIVAEKLPIIPLVSPNIVVAARRDLGNFRPAILDHYVLWNVDELFWRAAPHRISE
jgi:peptide/nickel transport system substrate-binding protein